MKISNGLISFTGRMEKSAYRPRFIITMFASFFSLGFGIDRHTPHIISSTLLIVSMVACIAMLSMVVRRLRDMKFSPWWGIPLSLLNIVVFYIVGIVLCFTRGKYDE